MKGAELEPAPEPEELEFNAEQGIVGGRIDTRLHKRLTFCPAADELLKKSAADYGAKLGIDEANHGIKTEQEE